MFFTKGIMENLKPWTNNLINTIIVIYEQLNTEILYNKKRYTNEYKNYLYR